MSHDKIKAAARRRMAQTGESYTAARRAVTEEPRFFALSYDSAGLNWLTRSADTLLGGGPGKDGVWVYADRLHIRVATFTLDVPRSSVRSPARSQAVLRGTTGVHVVRGRALINGSARGLVEFGVEPQLRTGRTLDTMFLRQRVSRVVLSLEDPDGFLAAARG